MREGTIMYLVSQDKKNVIKFESLEISSLFKKYSIMAYGSNSGTSFIAVGEYSSEEQAKAEMGRIIAALKNGETEYEVR